MMSGSKKTNETLVGVTMQGTNYMQDGQAFPWHPSSEDRLHGGTTSLPLAPLSGQPGGILHGGTTSWHPSRGNQETDYMENDKPGTPLGVTRGQTACRMDMPSPGTPLSVTRGQTTRRTGIVECFHKQWDR